MTRRVMAQGTFDVLHPGHVHYLREAAAMGDELHVVVSRPTNVDHKEAPVLPARQRRDVVAALAPVDDAVLGDPEDIFVPVEELGPRTMTSGPSVTTSTTASPASGRRWPTGASTARCVGPRRGSRGTTGRFCRAGESSRPASRSRGSRRSRAARTLGPEVDGPTT